MACPFQSTLELLGRRHALSIVWYLSSRQRARFNEIAAGIETNNVTLTTRLRELEAGGIVLREAHAEIPPRVEYRLADVGLELTPLLDAMDRWAAKHGALAEAVVHGAASSRQGPG